MNGPLRKEGVLSRRLGDEWMLYDRETEALHAINAVAAFVWKMCDGQHSVEDMARRVAECHDVPAEADLHRDIEEVIRSFDERGMLEGRADS